ncbi:MAG: adenosylcobinamide-GDP ribazoletransferase [Micromonosporaceae bacterium]
MIDGLRLALTTLTIAPVKAGAVDRRTAGIAMALAPLVGAVLGALAAGLGLLLLQVGTPSLLAAAVVVGFGVIATRALHLDGLADTLDALGSYRDRERALEIMKQPDTGPFGVVGIVLALLVQVAAVQALLAKPALTLLLALVLAAATARLAVSFGCARGVPAARPDGLGATVAGTVPWPVPAVWLWLLVLSAVGFATSRPWHGPLAVIAGLAVAAVLIRHAVRRLGGVTGDTLGAALELTATATLAALALEPGATTGSG